MSFDNRNLILFPEGTRGEPGKILPFKKGAASFSFHLNTPILPAVIYGSHNIWPRGKIFFSWPSKINVYILDPIYPHSFVKSRNPSPDEIDDAIIEMTNNLENKIKKKAETLYE